MGHRMISFLTTYLPQHPDFESPDVEEEREDSLYQLERLRLCLEHVALQIDEDELNKYITDNFDPVVEEDSSEGSLDQGNDYGNSKANNHWEPFTGWTVEVHRKQADSPTIETVTTTGTESTEHHETSSDEEVQSPQPRLELEEDYEDSDGEDNHESKPRPTQLYTMELGTDFLEQIANESVRYETDSEAVDSWAQDTESVAPSASSGTAVTYDPACIAFRHILHQVPSTIVSPVKEEDYGGIISDQSSDSAIDDIVQQAIQDFESDVDLVVKKENLNCNEERLPPEKMQKSPVRLYYMGPSNAPSMKSPGRQNKLDRFGLKSDDLDQDDWVNFDVDNNPKRRNKFVSGWMD